MLISIRYKILKFAVGLMGTKKQQDSTKTEISASQKTIGAATVTGKFSGNITFLPCSGLFGEMERSI